MKTETPSYVYWLIFGGLAALILLVGSGTVWAHLSRRADRRANLRAVADADTTAIRLRALRDTPDRLMDRSRWAELTRLEFDEGMPDTAVQVDIARANLAAALDAFCHASAITPRDLRRYAAESRTREEIARAEREAYVMESWSNRLIRDAGGDLETAREQWTGIPADLGKTQEWPTIQPRELVNSK